MSQIRNTDRYEQKKEKFCHEKSATNTLYIADTRIISWGCEHCLGQPGVSHWPEPALDQSEIIKEINLNRGKRYRYAFSKVNFCAQFPGEVEFSRHGVSRFSEKTEI
jgi:hypothetical protein